MSLLAPTYKFSVTDYEKLTAAGHFQREDRIELLNGELIVLHAVGFRHAQAVTNLNEAFMEQARRRYMVSPQNPVWLDDWSMPEPDIVLIPRAQRTSGRHPQPAEALLVIEVSDSSLRYDRRDKMHAYARAGVSEFWIFNLEEDVMEVFRQPAGEKYAETLQIGAEGELSPLAFPDVRIVLAEVIPPPISE